MPVQFQRFSSEKQAADAVYNELRRYLTDGPGYQLAEDDRSVGRRRATAPFVLMLAGGTTPLPIYERVAREVPNHVHPAVHLMLSDDRYVPHGDRRSNAGSIFPTIKALGLPAERFIHIETERPMGEATERFSAAIHGLGECKAIFALALLGIGSDGHTASLFDPAMINEITATFPEPRTPGVPARRIRPAEETSEEGEGEKQRPPAPGDGALLCPADRPAAIDGGVYGGTERISVSPETLLSFRRLIFFATGPSKREILYDLSRRPEHYAAGAIMLRHPNAEIWTDEAPRVR